MTQVRFVFRMRQPAGKPLSQRLAACRALVGFGKRLRNVREVKGLSGAEFGKGIGYPEGKDATRQSINDWEAERHYPNAWQLREICRKYDVDPTWLVTGERSGETIQDWPFSEDLRFSASRLGSEAKLRAENVLRAALGLDALQPSAKPDGWRPIQQSEPAKRKRIRNPPGDQRRTQDGDS